MNDNEIRIEVDPDFQTKADEWRKSKKIETRSLFGKMFEKVFDNVMNAIKEAQSVMKKAVRGPIIINGPPACPIPEKTIERFICPKATKA